MRSVPSSTSLRTNPVDTTWSRSAHSPTSPLHSSATGLAENYATARAENLLPIGVAEGCTLLRDLPQDHALTYDDVLLPPGRLIDQLRREQEAYFNLPAAAAKPKPVAALPVGA